MRKFLFIPVILLMIACSGDDGADGVNGIDGLSGASCAVTADEATYVEITCGDDEPVRIPKGSDGEPGENGINGIDGLDGVSCDVAEAGAYFSMICGGEEKARWAKAMCGANAYDPETHGCSVEVILPKCGDVLYDPTLKFCYKNSVADLCGNRTETFDINLYECRNGNKIYLKIPVNYGGETYEAVLIGTKTWMAKNLNYETPSGSVCYDNLPSNCDKYGRLYDWATAMDLPKNCNEEECESQIETPHQGICPSGWHIPTNADWNELDRNPSRPNGACEIIRTNTYGPDAYGFATLPGGGIFSSTFWGAGIDGYWWSSFENNATNAYSRNIYSVDDFGFVGFSICADYYNKADSYSVRCVKD